MSLITDVFDVCEKVNDGRDEYYVLSHAMSELGELAEEIAIHKGDSYKNAGADGVIGEAIDTIVCLLDLIYVHCKRNQIDLDEDMLQHVASLKLDKWLSKIKEKAVLKDQESLDSWYNQLK